MLRTQPSSTTSFAYPKRRNVSFLPPKRYYNNNNNNNNNNKDYKPGLLRLLCKFVWGDDEPLIYIDERNKRVNYRLVVTWIHCILSLRSLTFWVLFALLFAAHTLLFFLDPTDQRWPPLITGSIVLVYGWLAWFYTIYRTVYYHLYRPAPTPLYIVAELFLLYINSLLQNLCFYSAVAEFDNTAFVGMDSDRQSDIRIYWLSFNLAAETLAGLGTGSIFANPDATTLLSFLPVWLNSVQGILYNGLIVGSFVALVALAIKRQIKHLVVLESKLHHHLSQKEIDTLIRLRQTDEDGHVQLPSSQNAKATTTTTTNDNFEKESFLKLRNSKGRNVLFRRGKKYNRQFPPHGQY